MRYRTLGGTGIEVSVHCLGTMMFGAVGNKDHDDSIRIIHAALDQGINFVDTADMYSAGESEEIVGKALQGRRDDVVLATKVHFPMGEGPNRGGNSRRWILTEVENSLRRLRTDWIDLYQIHRPDPTTDIEETLSVLTDLVQQGKIRAFGCSSFPAEEIVEAHVRLRTPRPRPVPHRAAAVLDPGPRHRDLGPAGLPPLRHGRADLEPARVRVPDRQVPQEPARRPLQRPPDDPAGTVRPGQRRVRRQARHRRAAGRPRRRARLHPPPARDRLHRDPPGRHLGHPGPAHDGTARQPAERRLASCWTTRSWTGSTRSSRPAPTSTTPTPPGPRAASPTPPNAAAPTKTAPPPDPALSR